MLGSLTGDDNNGVNDVVAVDLTNDFTGVYGFFRRHQKKLLYTAGLFTLLTFSVTGPMLALIDNLFGKRQPQATIVVNGKRLSLQIEDYTYGDLLARHGNARRDRIINVRT